MVCLEHRESGWNIRLHVLLIVVVPAVALSFALAARIVMLHVPKQKEYECIDKC